MHRSNNDVELQTPRIVSLLSESYNPHVRYGAALAVGISCAGTGMSEAISLLEPLTSDVVDFVRQGALIAMAMVMVQISETSDSRVGTFRYCTIIFRILFPFWLFFCGGCFCWCFFLVTIIKELSGIASLQSALLPDVLSFFNILLLNCLLLLVLYFTNLPLIFFSIFIPSCCCCYCYCYCYYCCY